MAAAVTRIDTYYLRNIYSRPVDEVSPARLFPLHPPNSQPLIRSPPPPFSNRAPCPDRGQLAYWRASRLLGFVSARRERWRQCAESLGRSLIGRVLLDRRAAAEGQPPADGPGDVSGSGSGGGGGGGKSEAARGAGQRTLIRVSLRSCPRADSKAAPWDGQLDSGSEADARKLFTLCWCRWKAAAAGRAAEQTAIAAIEERVAAAAAASEPIAGADADAAAAADVAAVIAATATGDDLKLTARERRAGHMQNPYRAHIDSAMYMLAPSAAAAADGARAVLSRRGKGAGASGAVPDNAETDLAMPWRPRIAPMARAPSNQSPQGAGATAAAAQLPGEDG